jgi:hypothetical protein
MYYLGLPVSPLTFALVLLSTEWARSLGEMLTVRRGLLTTLFGNISSLSRVYTIAGNLNVHS